MATAAEYNLGPNTFPRGWFIVAESKELDGGPMAIRFAFDPTTSSSSRDSREREPREREDGRGTPNEDRQCREKVENLVVNVQPESVHISPI